jgi:hypothetical protein
MTDAKHTPGPWEAHQGIDADQPTVWDITSRHNHRSFGETPKGWFVATVHEVKDGAGAAADARLIAAAPCLLEALDNLVDAVTNFNRRVPATDESLAMGRAAIAKARGEA